VSGVCAGTHGQEKDVLASSFLEGKSDRNGTTLAGKVGLDLEDRLDGLCGSGEVPVLGRGNPPLTRVLLDDLAGVLGVQGLEDLVDVSLDKSVDLRDLHVGDGTDAELADDLGGDDSLCAGGGEGTLDTVKRQRGESPAGHQGALLVLEDSGLAAKRFVKVIHSEGNTLVQLLFFLSDRGNQLLDAIDLNLAVGVDQASHNADEVGHGLLCGTTEDTAVKVLAGTADLDAVVTATSQTVGKTRLLGAEPVVVADADGIGILEELLCLGVDEVVQTLTSILFHTLEAHEKVDGEIDVGLLMGLDGVKPTKNGTLVVGRTTTEHAALVIDGELEGLGGPAILLSGGLNIVVTVDEDGLLLGVLTVAGDDDGREFEILLVGLRAERAGFDMGTESLQFGLEKLAHLQSGQHSA